MITDILIIAIEHGRSGPARLPQNLSKMGLAVATLCPPDNALAHTHHADRHFELSGARTWWALRREIETALRETRARLVIPADEQVVALLHYLITRNKFVDQAARDVIVRSLGDPQHYADMLFKSRTMALARDLGLPIPEGRTVANANDAVAYAQTLGFPVIAKKSFSWAGRGVIRCDTPEALRTAIGTPRRARLRDLARAALGRSWYPSHEVWDIQRQIRGRPAMFCGLAWQGRLVGGFSGIPIEVSSEFGPSTSVKLVHHQEIEDICRAIVSRASISGFVGFDFILREGDDAPLLIECNPRPIQVCHLGYRVGADLSAALAAILRDGRVPERTVRARRDLDVALYPGYQGGEGSLFLDLPGADNGLMSFWHGLGEMSSGAPQSKAA